MTQQQWWDRFERFLAADPSDIDCDEAVEVLHEYVDLIAAGGDAASRFPGMAAHVASCRACADDVQGLLEVVRLAENPEAL